MRNCHRLSTGRAVSIPRSMHEVPARHLCGVRTYKANPKRTGNAMAFGMSCRKGRPKPFADSQIAATALCHGMTLVTRNVHDMADFGVEIFNPFDE